MVEITLDTKIATLLNNYENMKDILIDINPKFKKLNNPVLRRTLAKLASVKQAAIVGGMEPIELLNKLRVAVGQSTVEINSHDTTQDNTIKPMPEWAKAQPIATLNANELLNEELNPLAKAHQILKNANDSEFITITSDFKPEPLIEEFIKAKREVYSQEINSLNFITYIKK